MATAASPRWSPSASSSPRRRSRRCRCPSSAAAGPPSTRSRTLWWRVPDVSAGNAELGGVRAVVVNWRDRAHPLAGGAEEYAERVARALSDAGAKVTYLTARGPGQSAGRVSGSLRMVRRGGRWTVYFWALLWLLRNRNRI